MASPKRKSISKHLTEARESKNKDFSPKWDGCDDWDGETFRRHYHVAMKYYNLEKSSKDLKPAVLKWMGLNGYTTDDIALYKSGYDWRSSSTVGAIATCILRGMPTQRDDFNNGLDTTVWLRKKIDETLEYIKEDAGTDSEEEKPAAAPVNIQARVKEASMLMIGDIEDAIDKWIVSSDTFNLKNINVVNLLKGKAAKPNHARIIKEFYEPQLKEFIELSDKECDPQLKEGYSNKSKKSINNMLQFLKDIMGACEMIIQEGAVNRVPKVKKSPSKDKLIEKLSYMKTDSKLKLVSINPTGIIGASVLWCYDTKTKKIFKYISDAINGPLSVKGTTIVGFDPIKSIGKTLRKPDVQLEEFKKAGKIALDKYMDTITTVEIRANGRINPNQILLKVQS